MLSHFTLFNLKMRKVTGMRHGFQFLHVDRVDRQIRKLRKMQWEEAVGDAHDCGILLLAFTPRRICSLENQRWGNLFLLGMSQVPMSKVLEGMYTDRMTSLQDSPLPLGHNMAGQIHLLGRRSCSSLYLL